MNRHLRLWGIAVLGLFLAIGCSKKSRWQGKVEIVHGVTIVHNPERGLWEGDPSKGISFTEELSLGVLEGDPHQEFGYIQDMEVDSAGNIFILDSHNYRVVSFTPEGEFRWEVGEKGGGPGEFKRPKDLTLGGRGISLSWMRAIDASIIFQLRGGI